jgi:hypothetical protein
VEAEQYLNELRAVYSDFGYLLEIASLANAPTDEASELDESGAPTYLLHVIDRVVSEGGQSMSADDLAELRAKVTAALRGKRPDLEWPALWHRLFLSNASDQVHTILDQYDVAVGELHSADVNGSAIKVPGSGNSWVLAFGRGLSVALYGLACNLFGTQALAAPDGGPVQSPTLTPQETASALFDMLRYYAHLGFPLQQRQLLTPAHKAAAWRIAARAEQFVYLHELGHLVSGHLGNGEFKALPADYGEAPQVISGVEQEFEADLAGWIGLVTTMLPAEKTVADLQEAYAGAWLFLQLVGLLEQARDVSATHTHPPAKDRLLQLDMAAKAIASEVNVELDQVQVIALGLGQQLQKIIELLPPLPGPSPLEEMLDRASRADATLLDDIMAEGEARRELMWMLGSGAPGKLCRQMGLALGKAESELRDAGLDVRTEPPPGTAPLTREEFRRVRASFIRFKLLAGLVEAYMTPRARALIDRAQNDYLIERASSGDT